MTHAHAREHTHTRARARMHARTHILSTSLGICGGMPVTPLTSILYWDAWLDSGCGRLIPRGRPPRILSQVGLQDGPNAIQIIELPAPNGNRTSAIHFFVSQYSHIDGAAYFPTCIRFKFLQTLVVSILKLCIYAIGCHVLSRTERWCFHSRRVRMSAINAVLCRGFV